MKVLYCIHSMINRGGTERILSVKANALAADYGYEVVVVTSHQEGKPLSFPLCSAVRHIDIGIDFYRHHLRRALRTRLRPCGRGARPGSGQPPVLPGEAGM